MSKKEKKPIFKRWWFWLIIAIILIGVIGSNGDESTDTETTTEIVEETLGRGKKVSECTKKQLDAMVIILDNLQERAAELGL